MKRELWRWAAAIVLSLGILLTMGIQRQKRLPLRAPLDTSIPMQLYGYGGQNIMLSQDEQRVAGFTDYLMRVYERPDSSESLAWFSVYVGYYEQQSQGKTIHSPKNCLPGAGWEPLESETVTIQTADGGVNVNRYILQNGDERVLVLYWYQGRGRVAANDYLVKWDLLRDSAISGRSDEALVRIVVPLVGSKDQALKLGVQVAGELVPNLYTALPS